MIRKEDAIELWHCIQAHVALKQIGKTLDKHEVEDYLIFIRTKGNTFLNGYTVQSDTITQLAHLIENAAADLGIAPTNLGQQINEKLLDNLRLKVELDLIFDDATLSSEEQQEQIKEVFKKHGFTKEQTERILRKY